MPKKQITGEDDLERLNAKIARTRAALAKKLGTLRNRVLGRPEPTGNQGDRIMATKKAGSADAGHKKPSAKQLSSNKSHPKAASKGRGSRAATSKVVGKTKQVLEDALAGAALGAVQGAASAVLEDVASTSGKGRRSRKQKNSE